MSLYALALFAHLVGVLSLFIGMDCNGRSSLASEGRGLLARCAFGVASYDLWRCLGRSPPS